MTSCITCTFSKYNDNDHVKEDKMGRACSTNGEKRNAYRILVGEPKEIDHWEDQEVAGWTTLKWILGR
jgi:hypothetical protein